MMGAAHLPWLTLFLAVACVLSPFTSAGHDGQRLVQLAFLALAVLWIAYSDAARWVRMPSPRGAASLLILFVGLGIVSSLAAASPLDAVREVLVLALSLLAARAVAGELAKDFAPRLRLVLYVLAAGCLVYLVQVGVIYAVAMLSQHAYDPYAFAPGFANFRHLNHMQTVSLPLLVLGAYCCPPKHRPWCLIVAAAWASLLAAFEARGTILGLAAGSAAVLVLYRGRAVQFFKSMLLTAIGGMFIFFALFEWIPRALGLNPLGGLGALVERAPSGGATSMRDVLWTRALHYIVDSPWLGIGPAHYGKWAVDLDIAAHPHNWALQTGAEWGLPALICLLGALGLAALALHRVGSRLPAGDTRNHTIFSALVATGIAILVDGLVSGVTLMPGSQLMITLYIGCAAGWVMSFDPGVEASKAALPRSVIAASAVAAVSVLVFASAHDFTGRNSDGTAAATVSPYPTAEHRFPRFWRDEYFTAAQVRQVVSCRPGAIPPCP